MKQSEILREITGHEEQKNETIIKRTKVPGSQYTHIEKEGKHFLTIKNYKVTEDYNSEEELKEYMEKSWMELMTRTMIVMYSIVRDFENENQIPQKISDQ